MQEILTTSLTNKRKTVKKSRSDVSTLRWFFSIHFCYYKFKLFVLTISEVIKYLLEKLSFMRHLVRIKIHQLFREPWIVSQCYWWSGSKAFDKSLNKYNFWRSIWCFLQFKHKLKTVDGIVLKNTAATSYSKGA